MVQERSLVYLSNFCLESYHVRYSGACPVGSASSGRDASGAVTTRTAYQPDATSAGILAPVAAQNLVQNGIGVRDERY
jgi:hypothetical protein